MPNAISTSRDEDWLVILDRVLGLRAWGLIMYGALPANLILLSGILKPEKVEKLEVKTADSFFFLFLAVSLLPLCLMFLLLRNRHQEWYLTTTWLARRSAITTLLIVICASLIAGAGGVIQGRYVLKPPALWDRACLNGVIESYLFGIGSLVLSSTLFMSIMGKSSDLPGLPSTGFTNALAKIRGGVRQIQGANIWHEFSAGSAALVAQADAVGKEIGDLVVLPGHDLAKRSLRNVAAGAKALGAAVREIQNGGNEYQQREVWARYFAEESQLTPSQKAMRDDKRSAYAAMQQLRRLEVGD